MGQQGDLGSEILLKEYGMTVVHAVKGALKRG